MTGEEFAAPLRRVSVQVLSLAALSGIASFLPQTPMLVIDGVLLAACFVVSDRAFRRFEANLKRFDLEHRMELLTRRGKPDAGAVSVAIGGGEVSEVDDARD